MLTKAQKAEALALLAKTYPDARPALLYSSPFELLVATILSAQCTDVMVNKCTRVLFPLANTPAQFAEMDEETLFSYIKSCGFYRTKGKHIIETSRLLLAAYGGEVPADLESLRALPGVGRKTANVVASNAFGIPAIAVDTHVFRVSERLGLTTNSKNPLQTERELVSNIPPHLLPIAHHWLILHGRYVCLARKPKCNECGLKTWCRYYSTHSGE